MSRSIPRTTAALLAAILILPALGAIVPGAFAAPGGSQLATDPEGDNPPDGPDTDILRLGASADGTPSTGYVHLFITVADISAQDYTNGYQVQFKGPNAQPMWNIIVESAPGGVVGSAEMHKDTDPLGTPTPVSAEWILNDGLGDTIRIDVARSSLGATGANNAAWTSIIAETFPLNEEPNSGLNVDQTAPASWTLTATVNVPSAPSNLVAQGHATNVGLSWTAPYNGGSAITKYNVYRDGADVGDATGASFTDSSGIVAGTTYSYQVAAVNSAGEGPLSAAVSVLAVDPSVPSAVQSLVAQAGDSSVVLAWAAPADNGGALVTNYRVYKNGVAMVPDLGAVLGTSVTGLTNGQSYTFRVSAINSAGEGAMGSQVSATPSNANVPAVYEEYLVPNAVGGAGEPSIGVNQDNGDIYYTSGFTAFKVTNMVPNAAAGQKGSATWTDMEWPFVPTAFADPIGFLDRDTNRYFHAQILLPPDCSQMMFTDDGGATWNQSTGACESGNGHDHETVGGGPFRGALAPATSYPNSVYYCAQANAYATCAISLDGGVTFQPARRIYNTILNAGGPVTGAAQGGFCSNLHGHVTVANDGVVVVPVKNCYKTGENTETKGGVYSLDDGQNWHLFSVPGTSQWNADFDPSVYFSENKAPGAAYHRMWYAFTDGDGKMKVTWSDNLGTTWAPIVNVGASLGLLNTQFAQMVSGDHDRAAVAFLGTTTGGDTQLTTFNGVWHAYVAITYNSGATWQLAKVSTDPVQKGCISAGGTTASDGCRNLLDFNDVVIDGEGRVAFSYADGCTSASCRTETPATTAAAGSTNDAGAFAYQIAGRGLLNAFDNDVTVPEAPGLAAAAASGKVHLSWTEPANGNSPITGYDIYRDNVLLAPVGVTQVYTDNAVTNGVTYVYEVAAKNSVGTGPRSLPAAATPDLDLLAPSKVDNVLATAGEGAVDLVWDLATDNMGVDHYVISAAGISDVIVPSPTSSKTVTGLQNGRTYEFTVTAVDGSGNEGEPSDAVSAKPVRVIRTTIVATDPVGDVPNGNSAFLDMQWIGMKYDLGVGLRLEWGLVNAASEFRRHDFLFTVNAQTYKFTYDQGDIRCNLYTSTAAGGLDPVASQAPYVCGSEPARGIVFATIPESAMRNVMTETTQFSAVSAATCKLRAPAITETQVTCVTPPQNDRAPNAGGVTYAVNTPLSSGHVTFQPTSDQAGVEGSPLSFAVQATSVQGDHVTYGATDLPAGATLDGETGAFSWTPSFTQAGSYTVTFTASTGSASATDVVEITIAPGNAAPVLAAVGDKSTGEGELLSFTLVAADADGDALTYSAVGLPAGATLDSSSGAFSWTPAFADEGNHGVTFIASDGTLSDSESITISVGDVNRPPVLDAIGAKSVPYGTPLAFTVAASDPDADAVTFDASGVPSGASWNAATGEFSWTPVSADMGAHDVTFQTSDGDLTDSEVVTITVTGVNHAPTIDAIPDQSGSEGALLAFTVTGADEDGGDLTFSATNMPAGATLDAATGAFSWTPGYDAAGDHTVTFSVSDGSLTASTDALLQIANVDRAPVIAAIPAQTVFATETKSVTISATDPDGDAVAIALGAAPAWATLVSVGPGTATLTLSPGASDTGAATVTVLATAGGLDATTDVAVTVLAKAGITLTRVTTTPIQASPLQVITLAATITNGGSATDTFAFTVTSSAPGWSATTPASVTLAPGETLDVTATVTVPANGVSTLATLTAKSVGNPAVSKSVSWGISVPYVVVITYAKTPFGPTDSVSGTVQVTYLDGSAIVNAVVRVKQTPALGGSPLATQVQGRTDATGTFAFDFGAADVGSHVPGAHAVSVTIIGSQTVVKPSSYTVS